MNTFLDVYTIAIGKAASLPFLQKKAFIRTAQPPCTGIAPVFCVGLPVIPIAVTLGCFAAPPSTIYRKSISLN